MDPYKHYKHHYSGFPCGYNHRAHSRISVTDWSAVTCKKCLLIRKRQAQDLRFQAITSKGILSTFQVMLWANAEARVFILLRPSGMPPLVWRFYTVYAGKELLWLRHTASSLSLKSLHQLSIRLRHLYNTLVEGDTPQQWYHYHRTREELTMVLDQIRFRTLQIRSHHVTIHHR